MLVSKEIIQVCYYPFFLVLVSVVKCQPPKWGMIQISNSCTVVVVIDDRAAAIQAKKREGSGVRLLLLSSLVASLAGHMHHKLDFILICSPTLANDLSAYSSVVTTGDSIINIDDVVYFCFLLL